MIRSHMIHRQMIRMAVAVLLTLTALVRAQTAAPATAPAPIPLTGAEMAAFVAPYVDDQTFLVGHLDVAQVDTGAAGKFVMEIFAEAKVPATDEIREVSGGFGMLEGVLGRFRQWGGRQVYMVAAHLDVWPGWQGGKLPVSFLLPIEPGGDAKGLMAFIKELTRTEAQ
ncbi:MAG: hypothetical protein WCI73_16705, partial [Phycisphaerae bacterium]